ncbi:S-layer homology domain-containing protein [Flintibacter sp. P01028]|uniref:S-layer homology domain-containing protein n=1 Tax=Eubacteriales TaxID=186802 RepID=UPI0034B355EC
MRNLKRALSLALASVMVMGLMVVGSGASYVDVSSENNVEAIEVLQKVGVMTGDENGKFNPDANVTRNEMAVIMSNMLDYKVSNYAGTAPFTDVPSWAEPYVAACYTHGIISGYDAKTFGGSDSVTAAQAALMMMKALGYFQYQSDFGEDWQMATIREANKIDLYKDVNATAVAPMTRNDVAQLALNTLKSYQVEADNDTINVNGNGVSVSGGSVKYYQLVSNDKMYKAIDDRTGLSMSNVSGYTKELGEDLYDGDLECKDETDDFGRPATTWSYKSSTIGTYSDSADQTWTGKVSEKDLYTAAGSAAYDNYKWTVYRNGEIVEDMDRVNGKDVLDYGKTSSERWQETGNGVLTELYVDSTEEDVVVTIIDTFVAEVTKVEDNGDDYTVTISYKSDKPSKAENEFDTDQKFSKEDIVVLTIGGTEIQSMAKAEIVEGTVSSVKDNDYVKLDGTTYNYNRAYCTTVINSAKGLVNLDDGDNFTNPDIDNEVVLYLDTYGNAVAIEGAEDSVDDYLFVTGVDSAYGDVSAKVVFADGTEEKIDIDEIDGVDAYFTSDSSKRVPTVGHIYKWNQSGSEYDLESASYANFEQILFDASNGKGKVERDNASVYRGSDRIGTADSDTVFINTDDDKVWTGYKNVSSQEDIVGAAVKDDGVITILFMSSSSGSSAEDDDFVFISGTDPEVVNDNGDKLYQYNSAYINGEKVEGGFIVSSSSAKDDIVTKGLYQVTKRDNDDHATEVKLVVDATADKKGDYESGALEAFESYATYAKKDILSLNSGKGNLTAGSQSDFSYNNDTTFVVVELKKDNTDVDSVYVGGVSDIETDAEGLTGVFVVTVEDDGDDTPMAEVVLVIVPDEDTVIDKDDNNNGDYEVVSLASKKIELTVDKNGEFTLKNVKVQKGGENYENLGDVTLSAKIELYNKGWDELETVEEVFTAEKSVVADSNGINFSSDLLSSGDKIRVTLTLSNKTIGDIEFFTGSMTVPEA